jgi:hypothetical protein
MLQCVVIIEISNFYKNLAFAEEKLIVNGATAPSFDMGVDFILAAVDALVLNWPFALQCLF